jgi:hypothetical protein
MCHLHERGAAGYRKMIRDRASPINVDVSLKNSRGQGFVTYFSKIEMTGFYSRNKFVMTKLYPGWRNIQSKKMKTH